MKKIFFIFFITVFIPDIYANNFISNSIQKSPNKKIDKINYYSSLFKGKVYQNSPLGEGKNGKYDKDDLYRFDKFDCLTFVETVLALTISSNFNEFKKNINNIRYKNGKVKFSSRNHFGWSDKYTMEWEACIYNP